MDIGASDQLVPEDYFYIHGNKIDNCLRRHLLCIFYQAVSKAHDYTVLSREYVLFLPLFSFS